MVRWCPFFNIAESGLGRRAAQYNPFLNKEAVTMKIKTETANSINRTLPGLFLRCKTDILKAPQMGRLLRSSGILPDNSSKDGYVLRKYLRAGLIDGAEQPNGPNTEWIIRSLN
jgi:hypothetical protein